MSSPVPRAANRAKRSKRVRSSRKLWLKAPSVQVMPGNPARERQYHEFRGHSVGRVRPPRSFGSPGWEPEPALRRGDGRDADQSRSGVHRGKRRVLQEDARGDGEKERHSLPPRRGLVLAGFLLGLSLARLSPDVWRSTGNLHHRLRHDHHHSVPVWSPPVHDPMRPVRKVALRDACSASGAIDPGGGTQPTAAVISVRARGGTSWGAVWGALFLSCLSSVLLALALIGYMLN